MPYPSWAGTICGPSVHDCFDGLCGCEMCVECQPWLICQVCLELREECRCDELESMGALE